MWYGSLAAYVVGLAALMMATVLLLQHVLSRLPGRARDGRIFADAAASVIWIDLAGALLAVGLISLLAAREPLRSAWLRAAALVVAAALPLVHAVVITASGCLRAAVPPLAARLFAGPAIWIIGTGTVAVAWAPLGALWAVRPKFPSAAG